MLASRHAGVPAFRRADITPSDYWDIAEARACEEGSPIILGSISDEELERLQNSPQARSMMTIPARSETIWIDYVFADSIMAVLVVDHVSSATVGGFMNTWVQMTHCTISNLTYKRTILGGGRTQAISYAYSITSPLGQTALWNATASSITLVPEGLSAGIGYKHDCLSSTICSVMFSPHIRVCETGCKGRH